MNKREQKKKHRAVGCALLGASLVLGVVGRASGGIVTELPQPDADGWYVFGDSSYSAQTDSTLVFLETMVYPKFNQMSFPANSKIKLVGGIVMDKGLPADATLDTASVKAIQMIDQGAFGSRTITIASGQYFKASFGAVVETDGQLSQPSKTTTTVTNDVVMDGRIYQNESTPASITFAGRFSGSGAISQNNFGQHMHFTGPDFAFTGTKGSDGNYGGSIQVKTQDCTGKWKSIYLYGTDAGGTWGTHGQYYGQRLTFDPSPDAAAEFPLRIEELKGFAVLATKNNRPWRAGGAVCVWGGHTVHVDKFQSNASVHFVANETANGNPRTATCTGFGNVEIDLFQEAHAYLSTNVNCVVKEARNLGYIDYSAESNTVNYSTLRVTDYCDPELHVIAYDLALLPAVMKGLNYSSHVELKDLEPKTYDMAFDFDATVPCPAGCDGSGHLESAAAESTINLTFSGVPKTGTYSIAKFTRGGDLLKNWTVNLVNVVDGRYTSGTTAARITVVKDSTGIWLQVKELHGLLMLLR